MRLSVVVEKREFLISNDVPSVQRVCGAFVADRGQRLNLVALLGSDMSAGLINAGGIRRRL